MKEYFGILKNCPLFAEVSECDLDAMLACMQARTQTFRKGETLLAEGTPARYLGIVLTGEVEIGRVDLNGNRSILAHVMPSQMFGESFACADVDILPVEVTACADTEAVLIDASRITHVCTNACEFHNRMIFNLLKVVAGKNILLNRKIEITSKRTTREKLLTYLQLLAKQQNSRSLVIPYDRQGLADYLEVDRSGLSAEIGKLKKEGVLDCSRNHFTFV